MDEKKTDARSTFVHMGIIEVYTAGSWTISQLSGTWLCRPMI
jgi:hypothetical protein